MAVSQTWIAVACCSCCMLGGAATGYYGGRELLRQEMRSDIARAFTDAPAPSPPRAPPAPAQPPKHEDPPVKASLLDKGFHAATNHGDDFKSYITLTMSLENLTGKDLRAFDGAVEFEDLLGNPILGVKLAINDPIKAGTALKWDGTIEYNPFIDRHVNLRNADPQNLKIMFETRKVLFADGAVKDFAQ